MDTQTNDILLRDGVVHLARVLTPEQCSDLIRLPAVMNHDDDEGHSVQAKTLILPHVADMLFARIRDVRIDGFVPHQVDQMMKAYRLQAPDGAVPPHQDDDFVGPDGSKALHSIVVYLNDGYAGGETLFDGGVVVDAHGAGDVLLFRHDIRHEALAVTSGTKFVLKTDLFVRG